MVSAAFGSHGPYSLVGWQKNNYDYGKFCEWNQGLIQGISRKLLWKGSQGGSLWLGDIWSVTPKNENQKAGRRAFQGEREGCVCERSEVGKRWFVPRIGGREGICGMRQGPKRVLSWGQVGRGREFGFSSRCLRKPLLLLFQEWFVVEAGSRISSWNLYVRYELRMGKA